MLDMDISSLGKLLIVFGMVIAGLGLILFLSGKIAFIGKLPGDIMIQKKNFTFYFPLATSLLLSLLISLIIWLKSGR